MPARRGLDLNSRIVIGVVIVLVAGAVVAESVLNQLPSAPGRTINLLTSSATNSTAVFANTSASIVPTTEIGQPVSQNILDELANVSEATLNQVGSGALAATGVASPGPVTSLGPRTLDGKPEVLFMGAEYCPYCGAERWAMIVALDKFGNFTGLQYMQSSPTDVYPNMSTFSFVNATYTSRYVSFVSVELYDRDVQPLQVANATEVALMSQYDSSTAIPFVDFADEYTLVGAQYELAALRLGDNASAPPASWDQIASQLNNASSVYAQNVDGAANQLISVICKIDGGQPASICSQQFAQTLAYARESAGGGEMLAVDAPSQRSPR